MSGGNTHCLSRGMKVRSYESSVRFIILVKEWMNKFRTIREESSLKRTMNTPGAANHSKWGHQVTTTRRFNAVARSIWLNTTCWFPFTVNWWIVSPQLQQLTQTYGIFAESSSYDCRIDGTWCIASLCLLEPGCPTVCHMHWRTEKVPEDNYFIYESVYDRVTRPGWRCRQVRRNLLHR